MAAKASPPRPLVVARPRQRIVAPFSGDAVGAVEHLPVHDDPGADTRAENHAEDDVRARACAVGSFRQCKAVGIVGEPDGSLQPRREIVDDRFAVEAYGIRAPKESGGARARSGRADTDERRARSEVELALGAVDQRSDGLDDRRIVLMRRRHATPEQFAPGDIERDDLDLRAAEIDAETYPVHGAGRVLTGWSACPNITIHMNCMRGFASGLACRHRSAGRASAAGRSRERTTTVGARARFAMTAPDACQCA